MQDLTLGAREPRPQDPGPQFIAQHSSVRKKGNAPTVQDTICRRVDRITVCEAGCLLGLWSFPTVFAGLPALFTNQIIAVSDIVSPSAIICRRHGG
jgi:hypothetical protein